MMALLPHCTDWGQITSELTAGRVEWIQENIVDRGPNMKS